MFTTHNFTNDFWAIGDNIFPSLSGLDKIIVQSGLSTNGRETVRGVREFSMTNYVQQNGKSLHYISRYSDI